jgi:hypothetical protein
MNRGTPDNRPKRRKKKMGGAMGLLAAAISIGLALVLMAFA